MNVCVKQACRKGPLSDQSTCGLLYAENRDTPGPRSQVVSVVHALMLTHSDSVKQQFPGRV